MPLETELVTEPHLESPDDFYEALIDSHRDLDSAQSHAMNARLVLLLANHIGRLDVLKQGPSSFSVESNIPNGRW